MTLSPDEVRRILRRLESHFVPKPAVKTLRDEYADLDRHHAEVAAWNRQRNDACAKVRWMFGVDKARNKLGRAYPLCDGISETAA